MYKCPSVCDGADFAETLTNQPEVRMKGFQDFKWNIRCASSTFRGVDNSNAVRVIGKGLTNFWICYGYSSLTITALSRTRMRSSVDDWIHEKVETTWFSLPTLPTLRLG